MKNIFLLKIFALLAILAGLAAAPPFNAALQKALAQSENFVFNTVPIIPAPNSTFEVDVQSYTFNIDTASFIWLLEGKKVLEGKGQSSFSFTTGEPGSQTSLRVVILTQEGQRVEKSIVIRVADVDILWQALTLTPLWYKGKALPSEDSAVQISAFPNFIRNGRTISASDLIYQWTLGDELLAGQSGRSKQSFIMRATNNSGINHKIYLKAWNDDKSLMAEKTIAIPVVAPEILFYKEHPLEGPEYQEAISTLAAFSGEDIKIKAEPYYFSKGDAASLSFEWLASGAAIQKTGRQNIFSFNSSEGLSGLVPVELMIKNLKNIFQEASAKFNINVQ